MFCSLVNDLNFKNCCRLPMGSVIQFQMLIKWWSFGNCYKQFISCWCDFFRNFLWGSFRNTFWDSPSNSSRNPYTCYNSARKFKRIFPGDSKISVRDFSKISFRNSCSNSFWQRFLPWFLENSIWDSSRSSESAPRFLLRFPQECILGFLHEFLPRFLWGFPLN